MEAESIQKLRNIFSQNPDLMELMTGQKKGGRPVGAKNKNPIQPGKELHIIKEADNEPEEPTPISLTEAKKIIKQNSKPRSYSEEQKKKMLENLAKGREKRKLQLEAQKKEPLPKSNIVVKKYVIKQRQPKKVKINESIESDGTEYETNAETEDTDAEIYKKLKRKERIMKKLNALQEMQKPKQISTPTPVKPQSSLLSRKYSLFY